MHKKIIGSFLPAILLVSCVSTLLGSCSKGNYLLYHSPDNVYFNFNNGSDSAKYISNGGDSVVYTFAFTPGKMSDTVWLPVQLSGNRENRDMKYQVAVTDSGTTAVSGEHYAPFLDSYTLPADSGYTWLPVIVFNTDTLLTRRSVALNLHLVATSDLGTAIADMITAKVIISNKLEEPVWWTMWLGSYFSSTKYQLFIIATGLNTLSTNGLDAPKNLFYVSELDDLLQNPFTWVANNPQSGYVLQPLADGNYNFYNTTNPADIILLQKDPVTGIFYFIDENGGEVM